jgi:anti-sigma factor RsiW
MREKPGHLDREELGAYIDGELEGHRRDEVQAHLARCPADADLVATYRRLDQTLRRGIGEASGHEGVSLLEAILQARRLRWRRKRMTIAAAIMILIFAGGGAWWLHRTAGQPADLADLARDAAATYRVYAAAQPIPPATGDEGREQLASWLSSHIGTQIRVPNLKQFGFRLTREKLLTTEHGPAAQLTYTDVTGRRLTCFFRQRPASGDEGLRFVEEDGIVTSYGADDDLGYAMTARIARRELQAMAEVVYEGPWIEIARE